MAIEAAPDLFAEATGLGGNRQPSVVPLGRYALAEGFGAVDTFYPANSQFTLGPPPDLQPAIGEPLSKQGVPFGLNLSASHSASNANQCLPYTYDPELQMAVANTAGGRIALIHSTDPDIARAMFDPTFTSENGRPDAPPDYHGDASS
jgi:hypothetical protein